MSVIKINNTELKLDLSDLNTLAKFNECMVVVKKGADKVASDTKHSEIERLKELCELTEKCFDDLFGPGTAKAVFAEKENNLNAHLEAFAALAQEGQKNTSRIQAMTNSFQSSPNRKQRRADTKKKKKKKKPAGKKQ